MRIAATLISVLTLVVSCAGEGMDDGDGDPIGGDDQDCDPCFYLPLETGNHWTYRVTERSEGVMKTKTQEVGELQALEGEKIGIEAFRVITTKTNGTVVSWQEHTGDAVLRHREIDMAGGTQTDDLYQPYKLRIAEDRDAGATWTEDYVELVTNRATLEQKTVNKSDTWTVESLDEVITVPAGTFTTMRVHKASAVEGEVGAEKTYWFARGVGKVREDNGDRLEELSEYQVP